MKSTTTRSSRSMVRELNLVRRGARFLTNTMAKTWAPSWEKLKRQSISLRREVLSHEASFSHQSSLHVCLSRNMAWLPELLDVMAQDPPLAGCQSGHSAPINK